MRVLHVISCLGEMYGHARLCLAVARGLSARGQSHAVFTWAREAGTAEGFLSGVPVTVASGAGPALRGVRVGWGVTKEFQGLLARYAPEVVHVHGGWHPALLGCASAARQARIPVLLSLHGSLRPPIVEGDRRIGKRLAWHLYQKRLVARASLLHAASAEEGADPVRLGYRLPVTVIPNGLDLAEFSAAADQEELSRLFPACRHKRTALFLARLHPLKGVDLLLSAWRRCGEITRDWQLLIAGPDGPGGQLRRLQAMARSLGLEDAVTFCGPLYGRERAVALASAALFVLPSLSENFGLVVAESLAYGVPVITTRSAPWSELLGSEESMRPGIVSGRCGWWIEVGEEPLLEALTEALSLTDAQRERFGACGRELVARNYSQDAMLDAFGRAYAGLVSARLTSCR